MGSEQSYLTGIEIDEKSVEVSDFWSHHSASVINIESISNLSVLIGELFVDGPLWVSRTPLEKNSKNLMIYRHPCIVKYISSWNKSSKYYLAIEDVVPLNHVLNSCSTMQVCMGLHSILKALCFLHEKAFVSHNNICIASIYVTRDGNWKLGGMEYLCKFGDLSSDFLKKSKPNRYNKAVDPNEEDHLQKNKRKDLVDVYAYGVLVCEVLKARSDEDISSLTNFYDLCKNELQNINSNLRPKLNSLLEHDFFSHEFIILHSFLLELPLKSDEEKNVFFQNLGQRLRPFPEITVASQLGNLLLSRMVLLNKTAQEELIPFLLCPRKESDNMRGLFAEESFKKYLVPKLLEIFCVRDAQIRLLLLNNFSSFSHIFSKDQLQTCILPELLVGVKDTNDHLVSVTLRTLADLVPMLGAATVIGGKRAKLFNDGRPMVHSARRSRKDSKRHELVPPPIVQSSQDITSLQSNHIVNLPERSRPDGEEGETSTEEVEPSVEEDLDNWEDWDINDPATVNRESNEFTTASIVNVVSRSNNPETDNVINESNENLSQIANSNISTNSIVASKKTLPDISELDIKNQSNGDQNDEYDFFQDMEPIIETSSKYFITKNKFSAEEINSKLNLNMAEDINEDGWIDEEWE